jgi:hypothetical protein
VRATKASHRCLGCRHTAPAATRATLILRPAWSCGEGPFTLLGIPQCQPPCQRAISGSFWPVNSTVCLAGVLGNRTRRRAFTKTPHLHLSFPPAAFPRLLPTPAICEERPHVHPRLPGHNCRLRFGPSPPGTPPLNTHNPPCDQQGCCPAFCWSQVSSPCQRPCV